MILVSSIAALLNATFGLTAARADLIVDSATFNENLPNSYSGNTYIRSTSSTGTLNLNVAGALPTGTPSAVTMDDGTSMGGSILNLDGGFNQVAASLTSPDSTIGQSSVINLNGNTLTIGNTLGGAATTFYGTIQGGGGITMDGTSTQILAGNESYSGATSVTGGSTLQIGTTVTNGTIANTSEVSVASGGTFTLVKTAGNTFSTIVTNDAGGVGTFNVDSANTNTISSTLSDVLMQGDSGQLALTQSGTGTTILTSSTNSFTGATTVTGGVLQIGTTSLSSMIGSASPVSVSGGGTLRLINVILVVTDPISGDQTTENVFMNNVSNGVGGVGTVNVNSSATTTLSGTLSNGAAGTLGFTQSGTGTTIITGNNTYTGTTAINKGTLQMGDGTTLNTALASAVQVNATGTLAIDLSDGSGFSSAVALNATNAVLKAIESGTNTLSGVISGNGVFKQTGTGTTILTAASTYTGATTVMEGTLQIGNGTTANTSIASSGKIIVDTAGTLATNLATGKTLTNAIGLSASGAALDAIQSGTNTLSGVIGGSGSFNQEGPGTTILTAVDTYTGATTVAGGTLQIGSIATVGKIAGNSAASIGTSGILSLVNVSGDIFSNAVTNGLGGVGTLNFNSANTNTISGALTDGTGQLALTQTGAGTTILTNVNNTYSGATTVSDGILQIGTTAVSGSLGGAGGVNITTDATLKLVKISGNTFNANVSNGVAGAGALNIGTLDISSAGTNTLNGALTDGASGQLDVTQNGTGTTILANANNSYSGATTVSGGVLQIGTTSTVGSIGAASAVSVNDGGTLRLINVNGNVLGSITNGVAGTGTVNIDSANKTTVTGALTDGAAGTLQLTQSGTGTTVLTNAGNTYSGPTTVNKGILQIGTKASPGSIGANSAVTVAGTGTLNFNNVNGNSFSNAITDNSHVVADAGASTDNYTLASNINGTGDFKKVGANTVTLTGANTYQGATAVSGGTLLVNSTTGSGAVSVNSNATLGGSGTIAGPATLNTGGTIAPGAGSPGVAGTTLSGTSLKWNGGGALSFQLGSTATPTSDELVLSGALTKGTTGTYDVDITGLGYSGDDYTLLAFNSTTFTKATQFTLELPSGYTGFLVETPTSLSLDLTSTAVPAPNEETAGVQDDTASAVSEDNATFGATSSDASDATPALTATPEPTSAALLALGGGALLGWRRRRRV